MPDLPVVDPVIDLDLSTIKLVEKYEMANWSLRDKPCQSSGGKMSKDHNNFKTKYPDIL